MAWHVYSPRGELVSIHPSLEEALAVGRAMNPACVDVRRDDVCKPDRRRRQQLLRLPTWQLAKKRRTA